MNYKIVGAHEFTLDITTIDITNGIITGEIADWGNLKATAEHAPPPAPVEEYVLEPTAKMNGMTIEQFKETGWTEEQLVENGYCTKLAVQSAPEPTPVAAPAAPPVESVSEYTMTAKAAGATYEQFIQQGWTDEMMLEQGYIEAKGGDAPAPEAPAKLPSTPEGDEWPRLNENNEWVDSSGTIFNAEMHSMSKTKVPGVTKAGLFKKKRGYNPDKAPAENKDAHATQAALDTAPPVPQEAAKATTQAAPSAPSAPSANAAPSAPSAPSAPTAGSDDEPLDSELESIISDWT